MLPDTTGSAVKGRSAFSVMCVLEKCVALGARHIRLFGADMKGSYDPLFPSEEKCKERYGWDRWAHERNCLNEAIKKAEPLGIRIEKVDREDLE